MFGVSVRSWQWSGTSAQQSVGDHVKSAASSRRSNQSQQKQRQQADMEDHEKLLERSFGMSNTLFLYTASDYNTEFGRFRCAGLLFQPSSIDKEASGIRDTYFQNVMKCDADKNLYACVTLIDVAAMFQEIGEYTVEDLSCTPDHSSNVFALAQVVPQNGVAFGHGSGASVSDATSGNPRASFRRSKAGAPAAAAADL